MADIWDDSENGFIFGGMLLCVYKSAVSILTTLNDNIAREHRIPNL